MCQPKQKELLSDYNCSITKSWEKKSNRRTNQTVPQLGEQPNQTVPPLKVLSKEDEATAQFVEETNLTEGQVRGEDFDHFLFLYHQDTLDKSLVNVWAM